VIGNVRAREHGRAQVQETHTGHDPEEDAA
jgi:hypothetical protein